MPPLLGEQVLEVALGGHPEEGKDREPLRVVAVRVADDVEHRLDRGLLDQKLVTHTGKHPAVVRYQPREIHLAELRGCDRVTLAEPPEQGRVNRLVHLLRILIV